MQTLVIKGRTFEIQSIGSIVRVIAKDFDEIIESNFPNQYYRTPSQFVGKIIGSYVAD